jgi:hypothetical protein
VCWCSAVLPTIKLNCWLFHDWISGVVILVINQSDRPLSPHETTVRTWMKLTKPAHLLNAHYWCCRLVCYCSALLPTTDWPDCCCSAALLTTVLPTGLLMFYCTADYWTADYWTADCSMIEPLTLSSINQICLCLMNA